MILFKNPLCQESTIRKRIFYLLEIVNFRICSNNNILFFSSIINNK